MADLVQTLLRGFWDVELSRYAQVSATSIILLDHALTFDLEVSLIWQSKWSLGKGMFLLNRYFTICALIFNTYGFFSNNVSSKFCAHFFLWQGCTGLFSSAFSEVILQMRIYAMWSLSKRILAVMVTGFVATFISSAYVIISVLSKVNAEAFPLPHGNFCVPIGLEARLWAYWLPLVIFETFLCVLALIPAIKTWRNSGSTSSAGQRLIAVLFRDSVVYFVIVGMVYMTCLLLWALAPITLIEVPIAYAVGVSCSLTSRMVLNVREFSDKQVYLSGDKKSRRSSNPWGYHTRNLSDIRFGDASENSTHFELDKLRSDGSVAVSEATLTQVPE